MLYHLFSLPTHHIVNSHLLTKITFRAADMMMNTQMFCHGGTYDPPIVLNDW